MFGTIVQPNSSPLTGTRLCVQIKILSYLLLSFNLHPAVNTRASQTQTGLRCTEPQVQVQRPVAGQTMSPLKEESQEEVYQSMICSQLCTRRTVRMGLGTGGWLMKEAGGGVCGGFE